jgi:hypothetical protein
MTGRRLGVEDLQILARDGTAELATQRSRVLTVMMRFH